MPSRHRNCGLHRAYCRPGHLSIHPSQCIGTVSLRQGLERRDSESVKHLLCLDAKSQLWAEMVRVLAYGRDFILPLAITSGPPWVEHASILLAGSDISLAGRRYINQEFIAVPATEVCATNCV